MNGALLETRGLSKHFPARRGVFGERQTLRAVDGVDLRLDEGETLGLAGMPELRELRSGHLVRCVRCS